MLKPQKPIRRFDVFAEYNRLEALRGGRSPRAAKAYAIWLAKVVAARKFARSAEARQALTERLREPWPAGTESRRLGEEEQTAETFDRDVVQRMGEEFYREVFAPAIAQAVREGRSYESIRDVIRAGWQG